MKTLSPFDRRIIRAVLLTMGVPEHEHEAHIAEDFYSHHRTARAMAHYWAIFGSLSRREVDNVRAKVSKVTG